jgi:hypothetical protein
VLSRHWRGGWAYTVDQPTRVDGGLLIAKC